jgi:hypothetical protein
MVYSSNRNAYIFLKKQSLCKKLAYDMKQAYTGFPAINLVPQEFNINIIEVYNIAGNAFEKYLFPNLSSPLDFPTSVSTPLPHQNLKDFLFPPC